MELDDTSALILGPAARALAAVPNAPRMSAACAAPLHKITAVDEEGAARALRLPIERPLTVTVDGREVVTLMTLGAAPEWLALGYLRNQRLIDDVTAVRSIEVDWTRGMASVTLQSGQLGGDVSGAIKQGHGAAAPLGCGLGTVFGDVMRQIDGEGVGAVSAAAAAAAGAAVASGAGAGAAGAGAAGAGAGGAGAGAAVGGAKRPIPQGAILSILETMRRHDAIHRAAGSVHSCALFRGGELMVAVEDVSRHNGLDTLAGFMSLHGVDGEDKILFTTGRLTGEMVMKAAHNGISVMISRNGTTAVGYGLAAKHGMTLIGRAANRRYLCYIGADRIEIPQR